MPYQEDRELFLQRLKTIPTNWDGRKCILELKEADYQWRQMEWIGFYFEFKSLCLLNDVCNIPGEQYQNVTFDLVRTINWDLKASAIKTDNHRIILNDKMAMDHSIQKHGAHGEIIALCDVDYNDEQRTFQQWHSSLKGGKSEYEIKREQRTSVSRYRKTSAVVCEILFIIVDKSSLDNLSIHRQGRNSDGSPRKLKYELDLEKIDKFEYSKLDF